MVAKGTIELGKRKLGENKGHVNNLTHIVLYLPVCPMVQSSFSLVLDHVWICDDPFWEQRKGTNEEDRGIN